MDAGVEDVIEIDVTALQTVQKASRLNQTDSKIIFIYTVKSGDTLSEIAQSYYGSGGQGSYMNIAEANGFNDANKLQAGQQLKIPATLYGHQRYCVKA